jgi:hypothetical protein
MATKKKLLQAAAGNAGGGAGLDVEEVFSTFLYSGNGSTQTITNGIDLDGEGGLVVIKRRDGSANNWGWYDTERGPDSHLKSNGTNAANTQPDVELTDFNSNGFDLGTDWNAYINTSGGSFVSWTFRKAPRFFDVVTYTGDDTRDKQIAHNLGSVPGCIIVKATSAAGNWSTHHRGLTSSDYYLRLNSTQAETEDGTMFDATPTSTHFIIGNNSNINTNGTTYVAYLFAHDPMDGFADDVQEYYANGSNISGFNGTGEYRIYTNSTNNNTNYNAGSNSGSVSGDDNFSGIVAKIETDTGQKVRVGPQQAVSGSVTFYSIITQSEPAETSENGFIVCGTFLGNGSATGPSVDLGFEPQWLLIRNVDRADDWVLIDAMRGIPSSSDGPAVLRPESSAVEYASGSGFSQASRVDLTATGFDVKSSNSRVNGSSQNMIYIAIRRGTKVPTSATEVFAVSDRKNEIPGFPSGFAVDFLMGPRTINNSDNNEVKTRLISGGYLRTNSTGAETASNQVANFAHNDGFFNFAGANANQYAWMWKRAPKYMDVVAYTGNGTAGRTVSHNLGVAPEMMWVKQRPYTSDWRVYHSALGNTKVLALNSYAASGDLASAWNSTTPSSTVFTLGSSNDVNENPLGHIAYLFASLAGISKVGSYTGNGTSQTIDCGFSAGSRFVLIKRTDAIGDWHIYTSDRGIVAGNDPYLALNNSNEENAYGATDGIDPQSSGFIINQVATNSLNVNNASYIFYAIA